MNFTWLIEVKESIGAVQYLIEADELGSSVTANPYSAKRFQTKDEAERYIAEHDLASDFHAVEHGFQTERAN